MANFQARHLRCVLYDQYHHHHHHQYMWNEIIKFYSHIQLSIY